MTYRKHQNCGLLCNLVKLVRRMAWRNMSKPLGTIQLESYAAVKKHFSTGVY
jgi:hypothetical protein